MLEGYIKVHPREQAFQAWEQQVQRQGCEEALHWVSEEGCQVCEGGAGGEEAGKEGWTRA